MKTLIKNLLKKNPRLFDWAKYSQMLFAKRDAAWHFFDSFSRAHGGQVTFLYIGANDGLRSDPIRYFIVRDRWQGILVEPLPYAFALLKRNFTYLAEKLKLVFVNAAISSDESTDLSFWTFEERYLNQLKMEDRIFHLRKSSFNKAHVLRHLQLEGQSENVLKEIKVPLLTLTHVVQQHWSDTPVNLMVIDAEGHEASILPSIDFSVLHPEAIYFEAHNLGARKTDVYSFLSQHGYEVKEVGGDAIALDKTSLLAGKPNEG